MWMQNKAYVSEDHQVQEAQFSVVAVVIKNEVQSLAFLSFICTIFLKADQACVKILSESMEYMEVLCISFGIVTHHQKNTKPLWLEMQCGGR